MRRLVLGTRGSPLALWQARHVAALLRAARPDVELVERILRTSGDVSTGPPAADERGVFVRAIEEALAANEIDIGVHSLKDLPTTQPAGLRVAAVPPRHDPRDALVSLAGFTLDDLPPNARVGTGSPRRRALLLHVRPDLSIEGVRGNVDTRVRKLGEGAFDALVLAVAGLERLGLGGVAVRPLEPWQCLPAAGQGAIGVEVRQADAFAMSCVEAIDDPPSHVAVAAERACLRRLDGGCLAPATAHARLVGGRVVLEALVAELDGGAVLIDREGGLPEAVEAIGARLAERLLAAGAGRMLARARDASGAGR